MAKPHLRPLDIFAQMVAAGDIGRCAGDLGIAERDVERAIAALELRLGYRLFDIAGRHAQLTPAGRKTAQAMTMLSLEPDAPDADPAADIIKPAIPAAPATEAALAPAPAPAPVPAASAPPPRRAIMLAAPAPIFGHFQDALTAFEDANDDIAISLDLNLHLESDAASALRRGTADIIYFYALGAPAFPTRYGWSEQLSVYAGAAHPLAQADGVAAADLSATPRLAMESPNPTRLIVEDALTRGGIALSPPVLETDNMFEIVEALRAGSGWFAAFGTLARDIGRLPGIRRVPLDLALPAIEIRQAVGSRVEEEPAIEALAEYLFL